MLKLFAASPTLKRFT